MHIIVSGMSRLSLTFQELPQPDGSLLPGKQLWHGVRFVSKNDAFTLCGSYPEVIIVHDDDTWKFSDVKIAPDGVEYQFMMVFSKVVRIDTKDDQSKLILPG